MLFDLVVAQFAPAQDSEPALAEMHRVLDTNGRLALAYWGPEYSELDLLDRVRVGLPTRGNPAPAAVQARLAAAGFGAIEQRIAPLAVHHASVAGPADAGGRIVGPRHLDAPVATSRRGPRRRAASRVRC